jgi:hypothetical protein
LSRKEHKKPFLLIGRDLKEENVFCTSAYGAKHLKGILLTSLFDPV